MSIENEVKAREDKVKAGEDEVTAKEVKVKAREDEATIIVDITIVREKKMSTKNSTAPIFDHV